MQFVDIAYYRPSVPLSIFVSDLYVLGYHFFVFASEPVQLIHYNLSSIQLDICIVFLALGFRGTVLPFDGEAAELSAVMRAMRRRMGRAVGTEDCMIAGIARQHGAMVVTRDEGGFEGYGVPVINPWAAAS